jgi:hypothetical protein
VIIKQQLLSTPTPSDDRQVMPRRQLSRLFADAEEEVLVVAYIVFEQCPS